MYIIVIEYNVCAYIYVYTHTPCVTHYIRALNALHSHIYIGW